MEHGKKKKILVVDDQLDIVNLIRISLEMMDFEVLQALNGEAALKMIRANQPDLVLLDIMMPGMDGLTVCRSVRKDPKTMDIPIIMLTAKGASIDQEEARLAGSNGYIIKPFDPFELGKQVEAVFEGA